MSSSGGGREEEQVTYITQVPDPETIESLFRPKIPRGLDGVGGLLHNLKHIGLSNLSRGEELGAAMSYVQLIVNLTRAARALGLPRRIEDDPVFAEALAFFALTRAKMGRERALLNTVIQRVEEPERRRWRL